MLSIGIIGLPNVGKSTLFKALTKNPVAISNYPFCTIEPNVGVVAVPDERLEKLAGLVQPEKITPAAIKFVDIAGLVKNAHRGEGLGNQFLAQIREADAILEVVRCFQDPQITHTEGAPNPKRDIEIIVLELIMKDLETVKKRLEKTKTEAKSGDKEKIKETALLEQMQKWLDEGQVLKNFPASDNLTRLLFQDLQCLTAKPVIYVFNVSENTDNADNILLPERDRVATESKAKIIKDTSIISGAHRSIQIDLKLESDLSELSIEEAQELELPGSKLDQLISLCYNELNLITFYTMAGGKELRAWTVKKGTTAPEAAGQVHTDFQNKFIKAEIIDWQKLIAAGSWLRAKEKGLIRTEGKEYLVRDGEVIEIKI